MPEKKGRSLRQNFLLYQTVKKVFALFPLEIEKEYSDKFWAGWLKIYARQLNPINFFLSPDIG